MYKHWRKEDRNLQMYFYFDVIFGMKYYTI